MPGPATEDQAVSLFFAFPDGVYDYVCAECTALCCRGQGIGGSLEWEMGTLLELYPALGSVCTSRVAQEVGFITPTGRCFFLDGDNLCRIEKEHGKATKPGVCSLFPFNVFTRIGTAVAVSPHFMCPLRLQIPPRSEAVEGRHADLETAIRDSRTLTPAYVKAFLTPARLHPDLTPRAVLARESTIRDARSRALGHARFGNALRDASADRAALDSQVERGSRLLGLDPPGLLPARDEIDDLLLALASPLRLGLLSLSSEGMLAVLALAESILRHTRTLWPGAPSPQGAYQVLSELFPLLRLLARGDEPLEISRAAKLESPPFGVPELVFGSHRFWRAFASTPHTLTVLEQSIPPTLSPSDRTVLFSNPGTQMDHVLLKRRRKRRVQAEFQEAAPAPPAPARDSRPRDEPRE